MGPGMQIERSTRDGCVVVALTGRVDPFTVPEVRRVLLKDLAEEPFAVVCDLSGVDLLDPVCATVFSTVANHPSSRWPSTGFLLCGARPAVAEVLERLQPPHFLRLHTDVDDALEHALARPSYLRDEVCLAPAPSAPAAARGFVRELCRYWLLALPDEDVTERAVLVADELVTNAFLHARTEIRVRVELRGDRLHVAVRDGSPRLLRLVGSGLEAEAGRGLVLVERIARAWGVRRDPGGGKVVWCTLDL
jgi:anti-anti-sigma regulatory factor/anti-sigma regulatory factor (Ser/Thr protein kinase)